MKIPGRILIALVVFISISGGGWAEASASQPLLPPIPLDPLDFPDLPAPVDLEARIYTLTDGTRVEWYRLLGWYPLSSRVAFGGGLSYAGVEGEDAMRFGGGPAWVALSTKLGPHGLWGLAIDLDAVLPIGDESLYPVSSDAASVGVRIRLSMGRFLGGRGWLGWYARRVSPPPQSDPELDRPDSDWPSGSGMIAAWHAHQPGWAAAFFARYDYAGLPESLWLEADATWFLGADFGLRGGASMSLGTDQNRPMNWAWLLGVRWRPGAHKNSGK